MSKCTPTNRLSQSLPGPLADVDALLGHFFAAPTRNAVASMAAKAPWSTPASLWEAGERLHVELDVPGVSADSVEVTVENDQLAITVERSAGEGEPKYLYNERRFGKVTRSLQLPETVDPDSVEAELKNGVLRVSVAKRPETQPRKVEIREG